MGELRSLAAPARPLRLGGIPLSVPLRGGLSGNGMLPVFLQHLSPPVGACGERNYALFLQRFSMKKQSRISDLAPNSSHSTHSFIKNWPVPQLARFGERWHRHKTALNLIKNWPVPQLIRSDE